MTLDRLPKEYDMQEPDDRTLVMIGSLLDNDPWHLEVWARDDANAKDSDVHWYLLHGQGEDFPNLRRVSWDWLAQYARTRMDKLTVLGSAAP